MSTATATPTPLSPDALYEVVDGVVVELPPMSIYSALIASRLYRAISLGIAGRKIGFAVAEALLILDEIRSLKRRPDVAFVSNERASQQPVPDEGDWTVVPDLAVEVISPNDIYKDVVQKVEEYFRYGVRQVWVVLPSPGRVDVYRSPEDISVFHAEGTLDASDLIPGLTIPLKDIFSKAND